MENKNQTPHKNAQQHQMNWFQKFLMICSGANLHILRKSPSEWNKYAGIGGIVLFTAIFAIFFFFACFCQNETSKFPHDPKVHWGRLGPKTAPGSSPRESGKIFFKSLVTNTFAQMAKFSEWISAFTTVPIAMVFDLMEALPTTVINV